MNMVQHDHEPVPGLPAPLPAGETILWQGAPDWRTLARRAMRTRLLSVYFLLLIIWGVSGGISAATPPVDIALSALKVAALGAVAIALLTLFAYLVARTTIYTITTRRVVIRFGIALPMTIQVAYPMIESAGVKIWPNGTGDVAITLVPVAAHRLPHHLAACASVEVHEGPAFLPLDPRRGRRLANSRPRSGRFRLATGDTG